jgi:alcohol dehydrogenase class IV
VSPTWIKLASNTLVGVGSSWELAGELLAAHAHRVVFVVDEAVAPQKATQNLLEELRIRGLSCDPIVETRSGQEPDYDYLDEIADSLRGAPAEAVVAVGGGATMDLGKGIAILLANGGRGVDYRGMDLVPEPGLPVACVPTTAGSGSEATATASFVDRRTGRKLGINGRHVGAMVAALDAALLAGCPRSVTVGSGLDALVHSVEAVTARTATPVSTLLGCEATRLIFRALPVAVEHPDDLTARGESLLGAHLAALAMQNAAGGPVSGISYPLGVHYAVPHGYAGGVLLPHVVAANLAAGCREGYERLAASVGAADFADALFDLYRRIDAPLDLAAWDIGPGHVKRLSELTLAERSENLELNPVPFGRAELLDLLTTVTTDGGR